jgi:uncharacterized integral membrane protein
MIYLLTAIGLTPGGSSTVHIYTQTIHRTTQLTTITIHRTTQKSALKLSFIIKTYLPLFETLGLTSGANA